MTTEPHTVEVTQADRDAAAFVCRRWSPTVLDMIRAGKADGSPEVQAFARHRLASTPPLPATEMVEAVAREMEAALCVEAGRNVGAIWASERGREQMFTAARAVTAGIVERCAKVADREQERWHKMGVQMLNAGHAVTGYASRAEEAKDIAAAIRSLPLAPEG